MLLKATRATLAVLATAGSVVAVSGTAEAAAPACTTGTWRLTGAKAVSKGVGSRVASQGGDGALIRISANGQTRFDFTRSKRIDHKGTLGFRPLRAWVKYDKVLWMKVAVAGGRRGTITARPRTATGTATSHGLIIRPSRKVIPKRSIVPEVRRGGELVIPAKAGFTCSATGLHLHQRAAKQGVVTDSNWWFRRVGR